MKAIDFKGRNAIIAKNQPEYKQLFAHKSEDGTVTSCWRLSFGERLKIVFTGRIFLQVLTFNKSLQPLNMTTSKPITK